MDSHATSTAARPIHNKLAVNNMSPIPCDVAQKEGWALDDDVEPVNQGVLSLMRALSIELSEAEFLLGAAGGDVRKAEELHSSCEQWSGCGARSTSQRQVGSLTAASLGAIKASLGTSPPSSMPESPFDNTEWPTFAEGMFKAAVAQEKEWDFMSARDADVDDDEWDIVEDEETEKDAPEVETIVTFKDVLAQKLGSGWRNVDTRADTDVPRWQPIVATRQERTRASEDTSDAMDSSAALFAFDEDLSAHTKSWQSDGHSKNSQRGARHVMRTKQARAQKNSQKTPARR
jgi:hypothetical protein